MTTAAMADDDLPLRFAAELRRQLGMAGDAGLPGAPVVNVHVTPRVVAELPVLPQPLLVHDTGREPGAYVYKMTIKRQDGLIVDATLTPQSFIPLESFE